MDTEMAINKLTIDRQKEQLRLLYERHISRGQPYVLLDFPNHANVGDSAIWLGEVAILKSITGLLPAYVCTTRNFNADDLDAACPGGVIFIHGGGNLGDIWPDHQKFRELVITNFPGRQIVQLPQSIKFRNEEGAKRFGEIVRSHPKFTLYVRDKPSLQLAEAEFRCPTYLAPDSAFGIGPQQRHKSRRSMFVLLRTDSEKVDYDRVPFYKIEDVKIDDWLVESPKLLLLVRIHRRAIKMWSALGKGKWRSIWYNWLAKNRVDRGLAQLSTGNMVVTDRLHGHILCVLLGIPHITLDNDYGKVSNYMASWTNDYPEVIAAKSPGDAVIKYCDLGL